MANSFMFAIIAAALCMVLVQARINDKLPLDSDSDVSVFTPSNASMCERIHPEDLPEECFCIDKPPLGLVIKCLKRFNSTFLNDTIGMVVDVDPCNPQGSSVAVELTEKNHNVTMIIASVRAGEEKDFPIPGLSIIVPGLGHLGVDVAIYIAGTPDSLLLKIGLNACIVLSQKTVCASSIPGLNTVLPWWILSGTYHFGDICETEEALEALMAREEALGNLLSLQEEEAEKVSTK